MIDDSSAWYADSDTLLDVARQAARRQAPPLTIDGYDSLYELSRGGQGVIYSGVQRSTGRAVAVKVLHDRGGDGSSGRQRFEREVDLVAQMRHASIVRLYDTGTTDDGRAYLVMEHLRGVSLNEYLRRPAESECDTPAIGSWPIERVFGLFQKICDAVHYAHQRGVIHRDLKPSNIVIDDDEPYIVDFGLARIVREEPGHTVTQAGQFLGSLAWASPEQVRGKPADVDIRSDVYSLGVMLYQALAGRLPYETGDGFAEAIRHITTTEPAPPGVNDEVDTIVLRCLAKDPDRRYQGAGELGRDIERYLAGLPIEAKRDSAWYMTRKAMQRHKVAVTCAVLALAGLIGVSITMAVLYRRAVGAERLAALRLADAVRKKSESETVRDFLKGMLSSTRVDDALADVRTLPELLADASRRAAVEFANYPELESEVRMTIGGAFHRAGDHDDAESEFRRALQLRESVSAFDDPALAHSQTVLASVLISRGAYDEAQPLLENALATQLKHYGPNHPATAYCMLNAGKLIHGHGYHDDALAMFRRALAAYESIDNDDDEHAFTAQCHGGLARALMSLGDYEQARRHLDRARELPVTAHGEEHPYLINLLCSLGELTQYTDEYPASEAYLDEAEALQDRLRGDDHPFKARILHLKAGLRRRQCRYEAAEKAYREAIARLQRNSATDRLQLAATFSGLGFALMAQDKLDTAEEAFREALQIWQRMYGPDHFTVASGLCSLAELLMRKMEPAEAEPLIRRSMEIRERIWPADHEIVAETRSLLGACLLRQGRRQEARDLLEASLPVLEKAFGPNDKRTIGARRNFNELN